MVSSLVSAFGALLRVFYVAFGQLTWGPAAGDVVVAIPTMVVGADHRDHLHDVAAAAHFLHRARRASCSPA